MKSVFCFVGLFVSFAPNLLFAGQIGLSDFSPAATIQNFDTLGTNTRSHASPLLIGNDAFDGDDHLLRSSGKLGPAIGRSGTALSNDAEQSSSAFGFIEILLGQPALRAGLFVGGQFPWETRVEFYDIENALIGTLSSTGSGGDSAFVAWQTDNGLIERIRVVEIVSTRINPLIIDDFVQEIPEPRAFYLLLIVFVFLIGQFRRVSLRELQRRCCVG